MEIVTRMFIGYFTKHISELSYHFFFKSKGRIFDELHVCFKAFYIIKLLKSVQSYLLKKIFTHSFTQKDKFGIMNKIKPIVYKKTDEWYIEWQRVITSGAKSDNEWQRVVKRVTTNENEWYNEWQGMTTSDNEWQQVVQRVTKSENEWQRVAMSDSKWEQWYSKWKQYSTFQRMDDCHHFND